jgi:hypothetical protein
MSLHTCHTLLPIATAQPAAVAVVVMVLATQPPWRPDAT